MLIMKKNLLNLTELVLWVFWQRNISLLKYYNRKIFERRICRNNYIFRDYANRIKFTLTIINCIIILFNKSDKKSK